MTAMNASVQQADLRTAFTFLTVKNLTITWGRPAVPHMSAAVMQNMFSVLRLELVNSLNPSSVLILLIFSRNGSDSPLAV